MSELNVWAIVSSLIQISNFSSNSQMVIYLDGLSGVVHFPFNHVKELELGYNCAKWQIKAFSRFLSTNSEIYGYTQFELRRTLVCKFFFTIVATA